MSPFNKIAMDLWDLNKKCKTAKLHFYLPRSLRFTGKKATINQIYKLEICRSTSLSFKKMNQLMKKLICCNHNDNFPYFKNNNRLP